MKTQFLKITENTELNGEIIKKAADVIINGGLVAIPTETVYGLAGSALLPSSAEKIYSAKGRPADNPLIVHIAKPEDAEALAYTNEAYYSLAKRFMPGPLTIILPKKKTVPDTVTGGLDSVALRCPSNPVAHSLISVSGHPIAAPSANRSGIPSPTKAEHVLADMDGRIDMIIDGGECDIGLESTVIKLTEDGCMILRPGAVTAEMLAEVCTRVTVSEAVTNPNITADIKPESPGMKYKHYSPSANVILIDGTNEEFAEYVRDNPVENCGVIAPDEDRPLFKDCAFLSLGSKDDFREAGHRLFDLLRKADEMNLTTVYAKLPPKTDEYLAYFNRIIRAAGGKTVNAKEALI